MSPMHQVISAPDAVPPLPAFSQATVLNRTIYCSGSIGCDHDWKLVEGGVRAQTIRALENLTKVLKAANSSLGHIVKANVYLVDMKRDFSDMNEEYIKFFAPNPRPARTCVGVRELPLGALVEIECIAAVDQAA